MRPPYAVIDSHVHIAPWEQVRPDAAARMMAGRPNVEDFYALPLSEDVKRKILRDNALKLFDGP